jgi:tripartite-type tricarboxylate transporter receptor subunit TctC
MGPAAIPEEIVNKINQLVGAVMESPEFANRLESLGAERLGGTPQQFRDFFKSETATWSEVIKAEKIKVE